MVNNRSHRWGWRGLEVVVVVDGVRVVRGRRWWAKKVERADAHC